MSASPFGLPSVKLNSRLPLTKHFCGSPREALGLGLRNLRRRGELIRAGRKGCQQGKLSASLLSEPTWPTRTTAPTQGIVAHGGPARDRTAAGEHGLGLSGRRGAAGPDRRVGRHGPADQLGGGRQGQPAARARADRSAAPAGTPGVRAGALDPPAHRPGRGRGRCARRRAPDRDPRGRPRRRLGLGRHAPPVRHAARRLSDERHIIPADRPGARHLSSALGQGTGAGAVLRRDRGGAARPLGPLLLGPAAQVRRQHGQ